MNQILRNARIFTGEEILQGHDLLLADGMIQALTTADKTADAIDLEGGLLAPGFIDCQVNGGGGVLFNDQPNPAAIAAIAQAHRAFGTTSLLVTLIIDDLIRVIARVSTGGIVPGAYLTDRACGIRSRLWKNSHL